MSAVAVTPMPLAELFCTSTKDSATARLLPTGYAMRACVQWGAGGRIACIAGFAIMVALAVVGGGCGGSRMGPAAVGSTGATAVGAIEAVDLSDPGAGVAEAAAPVQLFAARNEVVSVAARVNVSGTGRNWVAALSDWDALASGAANANQLSPLPIAAYQVLPVPGDLNHAEFVRRTGQLSRPELLPRVLLPLPMRGSAADLSSLRPSPQPPLLWFDIHIPTNWPPGRYRAHLRLTDAKGRQAGSLAVGLQVNSLVLPASPGLKIVGSMEWEQLQRLYPAACGALTPRLLSRNDPRDAAAVRLLDQLIILAQQNRASAVVPALTPTVKWPAQGSPEIDWSDFDGLVQPWLDGSAFGDGVGLGLGYWPLPQPPLLENFDPASQADYWRLAAAHFASRRWIDRSPLVLPAGADPAEQLMRCRAALAVHPQLRALVPLDEPALTAALTESTQSTPLPMDRLITAAAGLVDSCSESAGSHWLGPGEGRLLPPAGADAADTRCPAWLAFLRGADLLMWDDPLPSAPAGELEPADATSWFYPGASFGVDHPLETVQLKWARSAEQDWEYLTLLSGQASGAGPRPVAHWPEQVRRMAELLVKPITLAPGEVADPALSLLCGTGDDRAWDFGRQFLVRAAGQPGGASDPANMLSPEAVRWAIEVERPTALLRAVSWGSDADAASATAAGAGPRLRAQLKFDLFDPGASASPLVDEAKPVGSLQWAAAAPGWVVDPQPTEVPARRGWLQRATLQETARVAEMAPAPAPVPGAGPAAPVSAVFSSGITGQSATSQWVLPVGNSFRRTRPLEIDGSLADWYPADALQLECPLVRMLSRPSLASGAMPLAQTPSSIYSGWSDDDFYLAFRLGGVGALDLRATHNFVNYQQGRAWGEDLAEVLLQPVYADGSAGAVLHVVPKPTGQWVERCLTGADGPAPQWRAIEGAGIRYAGGVDAASGIWRAELAIPWAAILDPGRARPALLRFNFSQHKGANGESASWAGPVDSGRDTAVMGLVRLVDSDRTTLSR